MQAIINGKIVLPDRIVEDAVLLFDAKIEGIVPANELPAAAETIDAAGKYVIPGLIDMHIHGYLGEDASDGSFDGIRTMAEGVAKNGVTSFLPTTMTVSYDELRAAFAQIRKGVEESKYDTWQGAQILGVNAEGPFITPSKKGAQAGENIRPGDADFLKEYLDIIRVFTIAPEMPGNMDCIREMAGKCLISMGHTNATFDEAKAGIEAGVGHVTHLFNAQTALMHRDPGVVGAALTDDRVSTELIADAFHVNANLFPLVAKMKGDKLVLITDCTRAGGLADGEYTLGGQPIFVNGIECRLADGTIAGSVLRLNHAVRNLLKYTSLPVWEAVNAASLNPAKRIGADGVKGSLEK
ncbi:MAG: N-acetylglucosamine-6-phosphate deacetylase, partial [Clostridia bacterium]|nr:N-acetylglucosamine-6-phosphate deacetylase [Clostridia bacterium]